MNDVFCSCRDATDLVSLLAVIIELEQVMYVSLQSVQVYVTQHVMEYLKD